MENERNFIKKTIGNTIFIVNAMQSETAKKSLEEKFRELCIHAVSGGFSTHEKDFEKILKKS